MPKSDFGRFAPKHLNLRVTVTRVVSRGSEIWTETAYRDLPCLIQQTAPHELQALIGIYGHVKYTMLAPPMHREQPVIIAAADKLTDQHGAEYTAVAKSFPVMNHHIEAYLT